MYRPVLCVFWLIYSLPLFAQSQDISVTSTSSFVSPVASDAITPIKSSGFSTSTYRATVNSNSSSQRLPVTHTSSITRMPSQTRAPRPPSPLPQGPQSHGPSVGAIVGEVVGGLVGLVLVLSFLRCVYSWRKTPHPDRIADVVSRHRIEREMAEMAQQSLQALSNRARPRPPPPPPYNDARLPEYNTVIAPSVNNV